MTPNQRRMGLALIALATLWAWLPFLGVIVADALVDMGGCEANEGRVHPCVIAGHDFGKFIYRSIVGGWEMLITWPFMLASIPVWIVIITRWWRSRKTSATGSP